MHPFDLGYMDFWFGPDATNPFTVYSGSWFCYEDGYRAAARLHKETI